MNILITEKVRNYSLEFSHLNKWTIKKKMGMSMLKKSLRISPYYINVPIGGYLFDGTVLPMVNYFGLVLKTKYRLLFNFCRLNKTLNANYR